ncbi:MAG: ComF family protein [Candidatus Omnitrophica bacterium]|nr:ComF family protein [Candidatus Omnitrophota bacterium]
MKRKEKINKAITKTLPNSAQKYRFSNFIFFKMALLFHNIIDLFFPEKCPGCNRYAEQKRYCFCNDCSIQIIPAQPIKEKIFSLAIYEGPVKIAIHALKYEKRRWVAKSFAEWMSDFLHQYPEIEFDIIIPVPLHPVREFLRTFNQSWLIACELGKIQKKPALYDVVIKQKNNRSQTGLNDIERRKNVINAYRVKKPYLIKNKTVLLIDDVYTTGSTVEEVQKVLYQAGAKKTIVLTVARV